MIRDSSNAYMINNVAYHSLQMCLSAPSFVPSSLLLHLCLFWDMEKVSPDNLFSALLLTFTAFSAIFCCFFCFAFSSDPSNFLYASWNLLWASCSFLSSSFDVLFVLFLLSAPHSWLFVLLPRRFSSKFSLPLKSFFCLCNIAFGLIVV